MLNKVYLYGYVRTDPTTKFSRDGLTAMCSFIIHIPARTWDNKKRDDSLHVISFGNLAKWIDENVRKDDMVFIEGAVHTYVKNTDYGKKYYTSVRVEKIFKNESREVAGKGYDYRTEKMHDITDIEEEKKEGEEDLPF